MAAVAEPDALPSAWPQCFSKPRRPPDLSPEARAAAVDHAAPMDTDSLQLPDLTAIQAASVATLRHVPSAARHTWSQVLIRAFSSVVHHNDD